MKNAVVCDVTLCGSCKNLRFSQFIDSCHPDDGGAKFLKEPHVTTSQKKALVVHVHLRDEPSHTTRKHFTKQSPWCKVQQRQE
jgi:hypothetical protein